MMLRLGRRAPRHLRQESRPDPVLRAHETNDLRCTRAVGIRDSRSRPRQSTLPEPCMPDGADRWRCSHGDPAAVTSFWA